jgi:hypothetical protein
MILIFEISKIQLSILNLNLRANGSMILFIRVFRASYLFLTVIKTSHTIIYQDVMLSQRISL